MKPFVLSFAAILFANSPVAARAHEQPVERTNVDLEMHRSTGPALSPESLLRSSSTVAGSLVNTSTSSVHLFSDTVAGPSASQAERINVYIRELRASDSENWPKAAQGIHAASPNLAVPATILNRMARVAWSPAERQHTRNGWITGCTDQNNALDALANLGAQAHSTIPYLVKLTHRACIHDHVTQALSQIGIPDSDQITQIANGLNEKDPEARQAAVEYLAREKPTPELVKTLGKAMNDSQSGVRLSALQALEQIHPEGEGRIPLLAMFLKDPSDDIRARALYMVGQLGPDAHAAAPLLHQALHDGDPMISLDSAKYLSKINPEDEDLLSALIKFSRDRESALGREAAELLASLNIHEARIDNALDSYRKQESLRQRVDKSGSGVTPETLAENGRTLKVQRLRMASRIVQDQPVKTAKNFKSDVGRVYCWTAIVVSTTPASVNYRWYRNGKMERQDELQVTSTTQSLWSTSAVRAGSWKVEVVPVGASEPVATAVFTVSKN